MNPDQFRQRQEDLALGNISIFDYIASIEKKDTHISTEQEIIPETIKEITPEKPSIPEPVIIPASEQTNYSHQFVTPDPVLINPIVIEEKPLLKNQESLDDKLQIPPLSEEKISFDTPLVSAVQDEKPIEVDAYDSLKEVFDFFRKRTNLISLDEINKKVKSRLKDRNQSASDIMKNVPLSGIINFELYKLAPEIDEIKPEQFARRIRMNLSFSCVHKIIGKLDSDYITENYPLTDNEFKDENGNYYLIEGTISFEKKEVYTELYKTLEERVIKDTKETAELLKLERDATIEKINALKKTLNETQDLEAKNYRITGYSIRKRSKSNNNSDFANFWQMIRPKIKPITGVGINLIGKGGMAAKGSNDPSGVYLYCGTPEAVAKVGALLKERVPDYNSTSKGSVDYAEIKEKIDKRTVKPVRTDNAELNELLKTEELYDPEIKELSKKSITYFGSGKEGMVAYLFLKQELEKTNINLTGKITEEDRRTFNLMTSIKNAHPKLFGNLAVGYRDTSMTNMTIDLFYLNKDVFNTMQDVKISNFVSRLNKNALIALSNGAVSEEEKEKETKIIAQFHQVLSCRQFKYNKIAENGLIIYHAMEK